MSKPSLDARIASGVMGLSLFGEYTLAHAPSGLCDKVTKSNAVSIPSLSITESMSFLEVPSSIAKSLELVMQFRPYEENV